MREGQINIDQIMAVAAAFIEIKTPRFCKKVQVDPYLEVSFLLTLAYYKFQDIRSEKKLIFPTSRTPCARCAA